MADSENAPPHQVCIGCDGTMERGVVTRRSDGTYLAGDVWTPTALKNRLAGYRLPKGAQTWPVTTYRCTGCGRLDSFAPD